MGNLVVEGSRFIYRDFDSDEILIDLDDYFSNKGRIPFHSDLTDVTIPNLIVDNMDKHPLYCHGNVILENLCVYYTLLDVLFIREHIKTKFSKRILEVGSQNMVVANHLLTILGYLCPESEYKKINDEQLNELVNDDRNTFDIVLINGIDEKGCFHKNIERCVRLNKSGGIIFALCIDSVDDAVGIQTGKRIKKYVIKEGTSLIALS